jgi:hypothetical protein
MKKKIMLSTTLIAALLMNSPNVAEARSHALDVKVKFVKSDSKKVRLMANQPNNSLDVSIYNEAGEVLFSGKVQTIENLGRQFDLSALADGNYTLIVGGASFWSTQRINIKNGNLVIDSDSYTEVIKPLVMAKANNQFYLQVYANTGIEIKNYYGEEIYSELTDKSKVYDLSALATGKYTFTFVIDGHLFTETVNVVK